MLAFSVSATTDEKSNAIGSSCAGAAGDAPKRLGDAACGASVWAEELVGCANGSAGCAGVRSKRESAGCDAAAGSTEG